MSKSVRLTLESADVERLSYVVDYYLNTVRWSSKDDEKAELGRLADTLRKEAAKIIREEEV